MFEKDDLIFLFGLSAIISALYMIFYFAGGIML